jgi:hypothetical protein
MSKMIPITMPAMAPGGNVDPLLSSGRGGELVEMVVVEVLVVDEATVDDIAEDSAVEEATVNWPPGTNRICCALTSLVGTLPILP